MSSWYLEPMTRVWVPQVAALEPLCFSAPWSEAGVAAELENPVSRWYVAVEDGQVRGYIGTHQVLDEGEIMNLATDPAQRRRGAHERQPLAADAATGCCHGHGDRCNGHDSHRCAARVQYATERLCRHLSGL